MQVKFLNKGTTLVISIIGEVDHHSAEYIRSKIDAEMLKSITRNIIFDFSKVSFMDSSGIGIIIGRYKTIQKLGGKALIVNPNEQITKIFEMSGIFKLMPLYKDMDSALHAFLN